MGGRSGNGGEGPRRKKYKLENERKRERERKVGNERDGTIDSIIFRKSRAFVDDSSSLPYPLSENRITE